MIRFRVSSTVSKFLFKLEDLQNKWLFLCANDWLYPLYSDVIFVKSLWNLIIQRNV